MLTTNRRFVLCIPSFYLFKTACFQKCSSETCKSLAYLKVRDFQEGKVDTTTVAPKPQLPEAVKDAVKKADFIPTKPPPAFEFCADPATINAYDL